uniref:Outer dense fiber protein 3B n=1 Tax=Anas zonorhyncha TaxID=75864 RepID=A0A8B9UK09_9AVES
MGMDGAFVGTWRPHRPRGPIMAQFTTPGPKYSIPGATGFVGHSPIKNRAPAYTCRGTKPPMTGSCGPGPRYFVEADITRKGKYVPPGAHIRGLPKINTEVTPGPTSHSGPHRSPSLFAPPQAVPPLTLSQAFHTPSLLRVQPSWGIGKEKPVNLYPSRSPALLQTPGPAAFPKIEVDTYKRRAPIYTMGAQTRIGGDRTIKPGPADYRTGKVRQPALSFCTQELLLKWN